MRQHTGSIVASARMELDKMKKTALPKSRMSVEGLRPSRTDQAKGIPMLATGKLSIGLPTINMETKNLPSSKSLAPIDGANRISLYKNDEERQSFMKLVNE